MSQYATSGQIFDNVAMPEHESLEGFWRAEHAIPSKPTLIQGDEKKFAEDVEAARGRAARHLHALAHARDALIYSWPDHLFHIDGEKE